MGSLLRPPHRAGIIVALALTLVTSTAHGDNILHVGTVNLDPPTLVALGVQLLISGDDNFNAEVTVRYRVSTTSDWRTGLPLFRVHPADVTGLTVSPQFAGSIFDLTPGTTYDIELHATDPDGPVDQTIAVTETTRSVPADPQTPAPKSVSDAAGLQAALNAAQPGDVITLANGTYPGPFSFTGSGTAANPIVIRGASEEGTILDGGGCKACNVLESYGSFVHVERLTLQHANRGLRFQGVGADGNVVRRVHIRDVTLGIGSNPDQKNSYVCDNTVEGRLLWPLVYADDNGKHSNDDGIHVEGNGHVVCHNQVSGFGDALKVEENGARADDFYGNEVLWSYDNAIELDTSEGNTRCFRNRFTNTYAPISFQPIFGGPAYALRNVVVNVANEQLKFHANGGSPVEEPSGMLVIHNTFVSPQLALNLQTSNASHHFVVENNLFVGPSTPGPRVVDWTGPIDAGVFDDDGWFPDGRFDFNAAGDWPSFAAMQAAGVFETHGTLLVPPIFASGLVAPSTYKVTMTPPDVTLASAANAVDRGVILANVNDGFTGAGPDLGAFEVGCPIPLYGVRPEGIDETNEPFGCGGPTVTSTTSSTSTTLPYVTIETTGFTLGDSATNPAARKVVFKSLTGKDPFVNRIVPPAAGGPGDPRAGGGVLTVYNAAGSSEQVTVPLPGAGWSILGNPTSPAGYRFRGTDPNGPIKSVLVKADRLAVTGGRTNWTYSLAAPPQGQVALRLVLGAGLPWCAASPAKPPAARNDTATRFLAAPRTPPPALCPPVP